MKRINLELENEICNDYLNGLSNKYLSIKYNLHRCSVQRIIKRNNINIRKQDETSRKRYLVNFDGNIISNNDAYILGLIYSDGNLFRNCIEISLNEKDKQILEDVSIYVYNTIKLSYRKGKKFIKNNKEYISKGQFRFNITSLNVANKLRIIGLCENKSLKIRLPKIKEEFYSHFIRGIFDGDGCIFISKKYKGTNRVSIVSNPSFCLDLQAKIEEYLNINVCINKKTKNVNILSISGNNQIEEFMDWIYKNSDLKLNRKYFKYKKEYKD
jgi:hypothetical protein